MPPLRVAPPVPLHVRGRWIDMLLATALAVYPLLPSGPLYFGLTHANYSQVGFAMLLVIWLAGRALETRPSAGGSIVQPGREVGRAWCAFIAVATGSALVGLSAENDFWSPVFWAHLSELPVTVGFPMQMLSDPMYPVAVWLVLVQGGLAFVAVRDLCLRASDPRRRARAALHGWLAGYGLVALLAVLQYVTRFKLHPYWVAVNPELVRSHSTLEDPNVLGAYLALGLGLTAALVWFYRPAAQLTRRWHAGLLILGTAALYTTVSRTAWIAVILSVLLFLALAPREWIPHGTRRQWHVQSVARGVLLAAMLVGLLSGIGRLFVPTEEVRFEPTTPVQAVVRTLDPRVALAVVFTGRFGWWRAALSMFADQPLVGVGLGRYPRLLPDYAGPDVPPENAHSFVLQVLGEMGAIGFAGLAFFLFTLYRSLATAGASPDTQNAAIARGGLLGTTAFLVTCVAAHPLLLASGQTVFATMLAVVAVGSVSHQRGDEPLPQRHRVQGDDLMWKQVTVAVAGILLLCYPARALGEWPPPGQGSTWGYSWGLFPEESAESTPFRWTGQRAIADIEVPAASTLLHLGIATPNPIRDGKPTEVRLQLGRQIEHRTLRSADQVIVPLTVSPEDINQGRIQLTIEVEPVFVPSEFSESDDTRELGLQLFVPGWS